MTTTAASRSRGQVAGAALTGAIYGAAAGAALGDGTGIGALWGAIAGGAFFGIGEGVTDAVRRPGHPKPRAWRILAGAANAAILGWLADLILPSWNLVLVGGLFGLLAGLLGLRPGKMLLGPVVGLAVGLAFELAWPSAAFSWPAALTFLVYRSVAVWLFREDQTEVMGEKVPIGDLEYVVPFATRNAYVGVDYLREYADLTGADFVRNPPDIGIVADFGELAGPSFDPAAAHPLIREFYEHTSRFRLSITPRWRWWMRPAYLVYRNLIARPLGQANAPFDVEEVHEGVVSWIDAIDIDHDGRLDFRAWVRAYEKSMEPLYVGIYTVLRRDDRGYVSVGFPLPAGNFTATLLPTENRGDGLLLVSHTDLSIPGHYLSVVDEEHGELTTMRLRSFDEEIDVYVEDGRLQTDHRFLLWGIEFMALRYDIERRHES